MYQYLSCGMLNGSADLNLVLRKVMLMHVGLQDCKTICRLYYVKSICCCGLNEVNNTFR